MAQPQIEGTMTQEEWRKVEDLFHQALEMPAAERPAFLAGAVGGEHDLAAAVEGLLCAHDSTHRLLDAPAAQELPPGMRLGPYELERVLGSGGMGTVYLARRADGRFEKKVAIKLVNQGLTRVMGGGRFDQERQILATLEHAGIARLLDAGLSDFGQPYLVMEWVDGFPLDQWMRENKPSVDRRLELWLRVADAVSYAHRNLIIHCDLKPSNILVTQEDAPKLVDFGIAKLLGSDRGAATATQRFTPLYASPEQISGGPMTAGADLYSLAIVLYELMIGQHPYSDSADKLDAAVRLDVRFPKTVPKDLAAILGKALRKDPEERYASAGQFADDVRRYRRGLPVMAQPESAVYRVRRFVARHRLGVSAAATVVAAMVTLTTIAVHEQRLAMEQQARAEEVTEFLTGLLGASGSDAEFIRTKAASLRVADLLDNAVQRLDRQFTADPKAEAALRGVVGVGFFQLGRFADSYRQAARALALAERSYAEDDPRRLNAAVLAGAAMLGLGRFAEAERQLAEVEARWRNPPPMSLALLAENLGLARFRLGKLEAAEQTLLRGIAGVEAAPPGPGRPGSGLLRSHLSLVYLERGEYEKAAVELERSAALSREGNRPKSMVLGWTLVNLANAYRYMGRVDDTLRNATEAHAIHRETLGESNPSLIHSLLLLAWVRVAHGQPGGEALMRKGVALQASLPSDHYERAVGLHFLGYVLMAENKLAEARQALEKAVAIRRKSFKAPNWRIAESAELLGEVYARQGDRARARVLLEEGQRTFLSLYGASNPRTREAQARLDRWGR